MGDPCTLWGTKRNSSRIEWRKEYHTVISCTGFKRLKMKHWALKELYSSQQLQQPFPVKAHCLNAACSRSHGLRLSHRVKMLIKLLHTSLGLAFTGLPANFTGRCNHGETVIRKKKTTAFDSRGPPCATMLCLYLGCCAPSTAERRDGGGKGVTSMGTPKVPTRSLQLRLRSRKHP